MNVGNAFVHGAVEGSGGGDQDGCVDKERKPECKGGINGGQAQRFAFAGVGAWEVACLHNAGMQVQIVRHDRCAKDADRYIKHRGVRENLRCWHEAADDSAGIGARGPQFVGEAGADGEDESGNQCFDDAEAAALQNQDEHHVERSDDDAPHEWNIKEQLQRDGGANDFGEVAGDDGQFTQEPQGERYGTRVMIAARLC